MLNVIEYQKHALFLTLTDMEPIFFFCVWAYTLKNEGSLLATFHTWFTYGIGYVAYEVTEINNCDYTNNHQLWLCSTTIYLQISHTFYCQQLL